MAEFKFVDSNVGGALFSRMLKGGLIASEAGTDEVVVTVLDGEEWADEAAWVRAIEEHYLCVFDDLAE